MLILLCTVFGCFRAIVAELSTCKRDCLLCKSENISYLIFYKKSLPTPGLYLKIDCWKHGHFSPSLWIFILIYSREHILDFTSFQRQKSILTPALCRGISSQSEVHGPEAIQLPVNSLEIYIFESHSRPTYQKLWDRDHLCASETLL